MSVEYRLAPEYRFPTAFDDCYAAAKELYTTDHLLKTTPEHITVIGDSAGGNLAAAVCLKARDTGDFKVHRQDSDLSGSEQLLHGGITVSVCKRKWHGLSADRGEDGGLSEAL